MKRDSLKDLLAWKIKDHRKPILLRGARQVGKTYLVRELASVFDSYVEINFEQEPSLIQIFDRDLNAKRIIRDLGISTGRELIPGKSLLFLDEIQECPNAIRALRYFYEEVPDLHVIAAGSLIDFALEETGLPVGRISLYYLFPLSFHEFLDARGCAKLRQGIEESSPLNPPNQAIHEKAFSLLMEYFAIGGMPEIVDTWRKNQNIGECYQLLHSLVETFRQDFQKYSKRKNQIAHLNLLLEKIPTMLGEKFRFNRISADLRGREISPAIELLEKAGLIYRIYHTAANGVPLGAEARQDRFKVIMVDIGLCQSLLGLDPGSWIVDSRQALSNKGMLTEAFVGQELIAHGNPRRRPSLHYWHRSKRGSQAEVDYVVASQADILPIEVKSGASGSMKSLHLFIKQKQSPFGFRFWHNTYRKDGHIISYPLYDVAGVARFK